MPWIDDHAPKAPKVSKATQAGDGIQFEIHDHKQSDASYYAIYRFDGKKKGNIEDSTNLLATVHKENKRQLFIDGSVEKGKTYTYVVTALDRTHNESKQTKQINIKVK